MRIRSTKMKKIIFIFIIVLVFCSCAHLSVNKNFRDGDYFYLENNGATMPVWAKGNIQSNTFIIFIGGGPGYSSMDIPLYPAFGKLQNDYALVCWDQRGCGLSQGNAKPDSYTLGQFAEDLGKLVVLIRHKYNSPAIFLMGHSWGGMLGTAYLMNPTNQTHISGWIDVSGAKNVKRDMLFFVEWVIGKAEEQINLGIDTDYWEKELAWYYTINIDNINNELGKNDNRHSSNAAKLNAYIHDPSSVPEIAVGLNSPFPLFHFLNSLSIGRNMDFNSSDLNVVPGLENIRIPSLILGGRHDGNIPIKIAYETHEKSSSENKHFYIFENSAHMSFYEEPDLFAEKVRTFIEKYR